MKDVTVIISTKDRYYTTLPLCLTAVANQTVSPKKVIVYDDGEQKDLREDPIYKNIFMLFDRKGIEWCVNFGEKKGQVKNHQRALQDANTEYIWRIDDDHVPNSDVLSKLLQMFEFRSGIGATSCLVLDPKDNFPYFSEAKNTIEQLSSHPNLQWFKHPTFSYIEVEHIYSTFLFKKEAGLHGYDMRLSPAGFREETLFTYEMFKKDWILMIDTGAIIWHFTTGRGGIKGYPKEMYDADEEIFKFRMKEINGDYKDKKIIVLDSGLGDHCAFKNILPDLKEKYKDKEIILACCYPDVFEDSNLRLISIAEAKKLVRDIDKHNIYKYMIDKNWKNSIVEAYRSLYLGEN